MNGLIWTIIQSQKQISYNDYSLKKWDWTLWKTAFIQKIFPLENLPQREISCFEGLKSWHLFDCIVVSWIEGAVNILYCKNVTL